MYIYAHKKKPKIWYYYYNTNILFSIYKICTFYVIIQKYIIIMSFDANIKKYANKGINSRV